METPRCPNCPSQYWIRVSGDLFKCDLCRNHFFHHAGQNYTLGNFRKFIRVLARKDKAGRGA